MNPTSSPVKLEKAIGWLQWVGVLPAAVLGSSVAQLIAGMAGRLAVAAGGRPADSAFVYDLLLRLLHLPQGTAFVVAGAKMAPRGRLVTAIVLAVVWVVMALIIHIMGPAHPGVHNSIDFAVESAGSALGLAYIFRSARTRPSAGGAVTIEDCTPRG
jgi:hypothetical protein